MAAAADGKGVSRGFVRGPQSFISGLTLLALCLFSLWLTSDLPQGTLRAMGPAMLPRWLAIGVGLCGVALIAAAFTKAGDPLEAYTIRGPAVVVVAVMAFGVTIRGFDLGFATVPTLGLMIAGPLAIFLSGFATPEARFRELVILALALTSACMILFGDLLNLPIPMFPQRFADLYPVSWSNDDRLRGTAIAMAVIAAIVWAVGYRRGQADAPVDVADHQIEHGGRGRI